MIVIVDYGVGNIGSVASMLSRVGAESKVSCDEADILAADKLILPGVGHFDKAMGELERRGLLPILNRAVLESRTPILGICLGAQLLGNSSEEGERPGLGWIDMEVKKFTNPKVRVPHMGWAVVHPRQNTLFCGLDEEQRFYFVHSYFMNPKHEEDVLATARHGDEFVCAVHKNNIFGLQFHPEKSHRYGLNLLKRFADA